MDLKEINNRMGWMGGCCSRLLDIDIWIYGGVRLLK